VYPWTPCLFDTVEASEKDLDTAWGVKNDPDLPWICSDKINNRQRQQAAWLRNENPITI
jgi:hypothetical protein